MQETSLFTRKLEKHKLCLSISYYYNYIVATGRTDNKPTVSLRTDDNGTPATWTFGLVFQQAIDRQDRTLQSRRTPQLYWNHWRYNSLNRNLSHSRTRTRLMTTCLVGTPPLRLQLLLHLLQERRDQPTPSHRAPLDTDTCPGPNPPPKYWTPKLTPNDIMEPFTGRKHLLSAADALNGNLLDVKCLRPTVYGSF